MNSKNTCRVSCVVYFLLLQYSIVLQYYVFPLESSWLMSPSLNCIVLSYYWRFDSSIPRNFFHSSFVIKLPKTCGTMLCWYVLKTSNSSHFWRSVHTDIIAKKITGVTDFSQLAYIRISSKRVSLHATNIFTLCVFFLCLRKCSRSSTYSGDLANASVPKALLHLTKHTNAQTHQGNLLPYSFDLG